MAVAAENLIDELLKDAGERMGKSLETAQHEFTTVRTGRASPSLLDRVVVDYYGAMTPLNQLSTVSAPEARLLTAADHRVQVLIPEQSEFAERIETTLDQSPDQIEIDLGTAIGDLAVFVQVEDADPGQFRRLQQLIQVAGDPFQVRSALPEAIDPGRIEVDPDKAAGG